MKPLQSNRPLTHTSMKQSEGEGTNDRSKTDENVGHVHVRLYSIHGILNVGIVG